MRTGLEITFLPGADRLTPVHRDAGAQLDHLCGPYWASIVLRSIGVEVTQEDVAVAASTLVPSSGDRGSWVPPGEPNRDPSNDRIARTDDVERAGTAIHGLIDAASELSEGAVRLVPIRGHGGSWTSGGLTLLVDELDRQPEWLAIPLLNLRTGRLWGTRLPLADALAYLSGQAIVPPPPEWDVGHFVNLAGSVSGARTMLLLRDSYPSFGWEGHDLQPLEAVASALARGDGHEGGCAVIVPEEVAPDVERHLKEGGFDLGPWDNGTPYEGRAS